MHVILKDCTSLLLQPQSVDGPVDEPKFLELPGKLTSKMILTLALCTSHRLQSDIVTVQVFTVNPALQGLGGSDCFVLQTHLQLDRIPGPGVAQYKYLNRPELLTAGGKSIS